MQKIQTNQVQQTITFSGQEYTKAIQLANYQKDSPFIYNAEKDQEGITEWFKFKGLTYVEHNSFNLVLPLI